jgi:accessory colonization factor AcfC
MNLTAALANESRIGGYLLVPQEYYDEIDIVAGRMPACSQKLECRKFIDYLHTDAAQSILREYGL